MKIVINTCYGGFSLSDEAFELYLTLKGIKFYKEPSESGYKGDFDYFSCPAKEYKKLLTQAKKTGDFKELNGKNLFLSNRSVLRNDPILVQVIEKLGGKANGRHAKLKVVEIPDDIKWEISEYKGREHVSETHKIWR